MISAFISFRVSFQFNTFRNLSSKQTFQGYQSTNAKQHKKCPDYSNYANLDTVKINLFNVKPTKSYVSSVAETNGLIHLHPTGVNFILAGNPGRNNGFFSVKCYLRGLKAQSWNVKCQFGNAISAFAIIVVTSVMETLFKARATRHHFSGRFFCIHPRSTSYELTSFKRIVANKSQL